MAKQFRLGKVFRDYIHNPRVNGMLYYVPKNNDKTTKEDRDLLNNNDYKKNMHKYMNSPTNVRRIWITCDRIVVEYFAAPIVNGAANNLIISRHVDGFKKIAREFVEYKQLGTAAAAMSRREKIDITGTISQAITYPYVCNNLEEIYFDWSALISNDIIPIVGGMNGNWLNMVNTYMNKQSITGKLSGNEALAVFLGNNTNKSEYPRLKTIGFISNLADINIAYNADTFSLKNPKINSDTPWILNPEVQERLNQSGMDYWVTFNASAIKDNSNLDSFKIKTSQYVFDEQYLLPKIKSYVDKVKELKLKGGYTATAEADAAKQKDALDNMFAAEGTLDEIILRIRREKNDDFLKGVINLAVHSISQEDVNIGFSQMSPEINKLAKSCLK